MYVRRISLSQGKTKKTVRSKQLTRIKRQLRAHKNINSHLKSFGVLFDEAQKRLSRKEFSDAERSSIECINQKIDY